MRRSRAVGTVVGMSARRIARTGALAIVAAAAALAAAGCGTAEPAPPPAPVAPSTPATPSAGAVASEQAGRIATDRFGGRVLNVESDTAEGEPSWEVEVADSQQGRIEVDISQATGAVVEMERD